MTRSAVKPTLDGPASATGPSSSKSSAATKPAKPIHPWWIVLKSLGAIALGGPILLRLKWPWFLVHWVLLTGTAALMGLSQSNVVEPDLATCCHPHHLSHSAALSIFGQCTDLTPLGKIHPSRQDCRRATRSYWALVFTASVMFLGAIILAIVGYVKMRLSMPALEQRLLEASTSEEFEERITPYWTRVKHWLWADLGVFTLALGSFLLTASIVSVWILIPGVLYTALWWHFLVPVHFKKKHGKHHTFMVILIVIAGAAVVWSELVTLPRFHYWWCCPESNSHNCLKRKSSCPPIGVKFEHITPEAWRAYYIIFGAAGIMVIAAVVRVRSFQTHWAGQFVEHWKENKSE